MWSLFLRIIYFFALLFVAFQFGWEYMMAGVLFFITLGRNNWEFLLLGVALDFILSFPLFFFTAQIFSILLISLFGEELFKTENLYNYLTKGLLLSTLVALISLSYYSYDFSWDFELALRYSSTAFIKIFLPLSILILLAKMRELSRGKEAFFK